MTPNIFESHFNATQREQCYKNRTVTTSYNQYAFVTYTNTFYKQLKNNYIDIIQTASTQDSTGR